MSYQYDLRQMQYFLVLAEELHFRKAAQRLYISQPGLSKQIKVLEDHLDVNLFERHNRKVQLTKAGEHLRDEWTRILMEIDQAVEYAQHLHKGLKGHLKFGYVGSAMVQIIPELLLKFKKSNPEVLYSLQEMDNSDQIEQLLSQEIDIGFVRLDRAPSSLKMHAVHTENFCLVLPIDHKINKSNFISLEQFRDTSFILFDKNYSHSYFEKVMQIFDDCGFVPKMSHSTIHSSSIFKLVELGFGVSIVPKSLEDKTNKKIQFIELMDIAQKTTLSVLWNTKNNNPVLKDLLTKI